MSNIHAPELELGKKSAYDDTYNPNKLFAINRDEKRIEIGIDPKSLPFYGYDLWNHYEVSWLNNKGKPMVGIAEIVYNCMSPNIIESKSMKLYFNGFNQTSISSIDKLTTMIEKDLTAQLNYPATVNLYLLQDNSYLTSTTPLSGELIDDLDVTCTEYQVNPKLLHTSDAEVSETLCSNLLKSNCLVTNQPDWGSVQITYSGHKINRASLLQYLVSFRNHNEFHEQCIERIFMDIMEFCKPTNLTVYGRYTRRGGIDINPIRSTLPDVVIPKIRLIRQ